jgi:hypothetical protein
MRDGILALNHQEYKHDETEQPRGNIPGKTSKTSHVDCPDFDFGKKELVGLV